MQRPSRRDFLKVLTAYLVGLSGLLGMAGIGRYLSYDSGPRRKTEFDLGPAESLQIGSRTRLDEIPALILHDSVGFSALSLRCTHLGCTVEDSARGFECPCHGSQYDHQGGVTRGPARKPLPRLQVEVDSQGHLIIRRN